MQFREYLSKLKVSIVPAIIISVVHLVFFRPILIIISTGDFTYYLLLDIIFYLYLLLIQVFLHVIHII